ncbi:hypothetical protein Syun_024602 [Stephania yunnanensis]|uniref:Anthocyanin acyltransferase n=1 Tax=Stephania yunnanensis TaxID=152371 RepID=A0AAP0I4M9_9MAGN
MRRKSHDITEYVPLVPVLISKPDLHAHLMAVLQVTLFPNSGITVGIACSDPRRLGRKDHYWLQFANHKVYETDFGWGRPKKVEVVSVEESGATWLSKSRDGENGGGVEVGVILSKVEMDAFGSLFADTLNKIVP